jgi:aminoglycoside 3-N-acetyltransferase
MYIYECDSKKISTDDFFNAMNRLGIKSGDTVLLHSDILGFGKPLVFDRIQFADVLISIFEEQLGDKGTLIMPTYSYSFTDGVLYDVENSRSKVGYLTDMFRQKKEVTRNTHPIFSFAVSGKQTDIINFTDNTCFGEGSVFANFRKTAVKNVMFGTKRGGYTFIHHIEQMFGVPYRYNKNFSGKIRHNGYETECVVEYYVRNYDYQLDTVIKDPAFSVLEKQGLFYEVKLGRGAISYIDCDVWFQEGTKMLENNIHAFL